MLVTDACARGEGNLLAVIFLSAFTITLLYNRPRLERYPSLRALSIQQKFQFEISETSRAQ